MPHLNDLSQNKVIEGNDGERWIVDSSITTPDTIDIRLKLLKVAEELIKEQ
jgi:hypothetical protein